MNRKGRFCMICVFFLIGPFALKAQFYYSDILNNQSANRHFQILKNNKISNVRGESFEADGRPTEDFSFVQQVNPSFSQLKTVTSAPLSGRSALTNFFNSQGLLYRTTDSSTSSFTQYEYKYDSLSRLVQISSSSNIVGEKIKVTETHDWVYDAAGAPAKMIRIKDKSDTTLYLFVKDEKGKIIEEQSFYKEAAGEKTYYYYNDQQMLSDIVRFNQRVGKLLPDYLFNYNEKKELQEMVTVQDGGVDYLTWRYIYSENGLKMEEQCLNKLKQLVGRLVYHYQNKN